MTYRVIPVAFFSQGNLLAGEFFLPRSASPVPGVVLCHGLASDHRTLNSVAHSLARRGIAALGFDFPGHGRSLGVFDGDGAADVAAALAFLKSSPSIDHRSLGLVGHSLGARAALLAAGREAVSALVALAPPPEFPRPSPAFPWPQRLARLAVGLWEYPGRGFLPWLHPVHGFFTWLWMRLRGYRLLVDWTLCLERWGLGQLSGAVGKLENTALLFVHCTRDARTPYSASVALYRKALAASKALLLFPGGFHAAPLYPGRLRARWLDWLVSVLRGGGGGFWEGERELRPACQLLLRRR